jgi:hypothetical protein
MRSKREQKITEKVTWLSGPKDEIDAATLLLTDNTNHGVRLGIELSRLDHTRCEWRVDVGRHLRSARQSHRSGRTIERRRKRSLHLRLRRGLGEGRRDPEARLGWDATRRISWSGIARLGRIPGLERITWMERVPRSERAAGVNRTSKMDGIPVVTMPMVVGETAMTVMIVMTMIAVMNMTMMAVVAIPVMARWL